MSTLLLVGRDDFPLRQAGNLAGFASEWTDCASLVSDAHTIVGRVASGEIGGVLACHVDALVEVARMTTSLGLLGLTIESAGWIASRSALRRRLSERRVAQPEYRLLPSRADALEAAEGLDTPLYVMPDTDGAPHESAVAYRDDLPLAIKRATRDLSGADAVVESHPLGDTYSVVCVVGADANSVAAIVGHESAPSPFRFPMRLRYPVELDSAFEDALCALAREAVDALEIRHAMVRVDIVRAGERLLVLNVDALPPWTWFPVDLPARAGGAGLIENALRIATQDAPLFMRPSCAVVVAWISVTSGEVISIEGVEKAGRLEGVFEVQLHIGVGDVVRHVVDPEGRDRIGYVAATGADLASAEAAVDAALACCRIETQAIR